MRIFILFIFLLIGCGNNTEMNGSHILDTNQTRVYGKPQNLNIDIKSYTNATIYMPRDIKEGKKLPIILFAPGWGSKDHNDYKALLSFIASSGYVAIYVSSPDEYGIDESINRYDLILNDTSISKYFDKSKFGLVGHSSGGGIIFKILDHYSKNGYGVNGRFIFAMDPWFAFGMSENDFKNFPKNTKVVIQQYGNSGGTDPRIALTIFDKLAPLGDKNRDYQVYGQLNHGYPFANNMDYSQKQVILKPLDALMDFVFNSNDYAYKFALELGSDTPYKDKLQEVLPSSKYSYKCYPENDYLKSVLQYSDIDYCKIVP